MLKTLSVSSVGGVKIRHSKKIIKQIYYIFGHQNKSAVKFKLLRQSMIVILFLNDFIISIPGSKEEEEGLLSILSIVKLMLFLNA